MAEDAAQVGGEGPQRLRRDSAGTPQGSVFLSPAVKINVFFQDGLPARAVSRRKKVPPPHEPAGGRVCLLFSCHWECFLVAVGSASGRIETNFLHKLLWFGLEVIIFYHYFCEREMSYLDCSLGTTAAIKCGRKRNNFMKDL